jgi:hypothetical protein
MLPVTSVCPTHPPLRSRGPVWRLGRRRRLAGARGAAAVRPAVGRGGVRQGPRHGAGPGAAPGAGGVVSLGPRGGGGGGDGLGRCWSLPCPAVLAHPFTSTHTPAFPLLPRCGCGSAGWHQLKRAPVATDWAAWQLPSYWPSGFKDLTPAGAAPRLGGRGARPRCALLLPRLVPLSPLRAANPLPPFAPPAVGRPQRTRWKGLPAANWPSFEGQDRASYMYGACLGGRGGWGARERSASPQSRDGRGATDVPRLHAQRGPTSLPSLDPQPTHQPSTLPPPRLLHAVERARGDAGVAAGGDGPRGGARRRPGRRHRGRRRRPRLLRRRQQQRQRRRPRGAVVVGRGPQRRPRGRRRQQARRPRRRQARLGQLGRRRRRRRGRRRRRRGRRRRAARPGAHVAAPGAADQAARATQRHFQVGGVRGRGLQGVARGPAAAAARASLQASASTKPANLRALTAPRLLCKGTAPRSSSSPTRCKSAASAASRAACWSAHCRRAAWPSTPSTTCGRGTSARSRSCCRSPRRTVRRSVVRAAGLMVWGRRSPLSRSNARHAALQPLPGTNPLPAAHLALPLPAPGSPELRRDAAAARVLVLRLPLEAGDLGDAATIGHVLEVLLRCGWGCIEGGEPRAAAFTTHALACAAPQPRTFLQLDSSILTLPRPFPPLLSPTFLPTL